MNALSNHTELSVFASILLRMLKDRQTRLRVDAGEVVFVDDDAKNIEVASALGIHSSHRNIGLKMRLLRDWEDDPPSTIARH
jgi:FMN phosphatase YigB (HAD superfamily)